MDKHPQQAARECAIRFPVAESVTSTDTVYETITDTVSVEADPVYVQVDCPPATKPTVVTKACPPCKAETITVTKTQYVTREIRTRDTAAETVLKNELGAEASKADGYAAKYRTFLWLFLILLLLNGAYLFYRIKIKR